MLQWMLLASLLAQSHALYFYIEANSAKCFYEELPKDTLVVGTPPLSPCSTSYPPTFPFYTYTDAYPGHYTAEILNPQTHTYIQDPSVNIDITVHEIFDNEHQVVTQRGSTTGRFTFSAADSGEHRLCFTPSSASIGGGWLSGGGSIPAVKFTLDMVIGETSKIEATDKGKMGELAQKVRDLNSRLQDIKREQVFQRVSILSTAGNCWEEFGLIGLRFRNGKQSLETNLRLRMRRS
jgi:p24 family protein alpha